MPANKCYLICSSVALRSRYGAQPCALVSHYLGWTNQKIEDRLTEHTRGTGAALTRAFIAEGGELTITRVWSGGWKVEKKLKGYRNRRLLCPRCSGPAAMKRGPSGVRRGRSLWAARKGMQIPAMTLREERKPFEGEPSEPIAEVCRCCGHDLRDGHAWDCDGGEVVRVPYSPSTRHALPDENEDTEIPF